MRGNSFGNLFTITTFGESHGPAIGVIIDGIPAGIEVSLSDLQLQLDRRRPGRLDVSTARNEEDKATIQSGIFENRTLGTPITVLIENKNQKSEDYAPLKEVYRPGHADKTTMDKFGFRDYRGGGRASGRETAARVVGGYFASLIIPNINFQAYISQIAHLKFKPKNSQKFITSPLGLADSQYDEEVRSFLLGLKNKGESAGGLVSLKITGVPAGLGEPVFDKLKADFSKAFMSIGSCMGVHFGLGIDFIEKLGTEVSTNSSHFGGIEGGISNGSPIECQLIFKAPSTVGEKAKEGRHDPCILPRVLPVVEAMAKVVLADHFLRQNAFQIS